MQLLRISIFICCLIFNSYVICQSIEYKVDHIGYAQGLSGQLVRCIKEDNHGHLWVATFTELNKYDGFNTKIFSSDDTALSNETFIDLLKDSKGNIWALQTNMNKTSSTLFRNTEYFTYSYDISIIEPVTDSITAAEDYLKHPDFDLEEIIWVCQRGDIIYLIDKAGFVYSYKDQLEKLFQFEIKDQFVGITDHHSYCMINNEHVIQEFDFNNSLIHSYDDILLNVKDRVGVCKNGALIYMDSDKEYYKGLYRLNNGTKKKLPNYSKNDDNRTPMVHNKSRQLDLEFCETTIPLSMIGNQAYLSEDTNDIFKKFETIYKTVSDIEISESGNYYVATDIGVTVICKSVKHFSHFKRGENKINSVRGMIRYDDIVMSTGLENKAFAESPDGTYNVDFLPEDMMHAISYYRDASNKDHIWAAGHIDQGLLLIDLAKEKIIYPEDVLWQLLYNFQRSSITNTLYAYGESGLYRKIASPSSWEKVDLNIDSVKITIVNHIIENDQKLYLATEEGLLIYDEINNSKNLLQFPIHGKSCKLSFIHQDRQHSNILWLGTKHNGVIKYNILDGRLWNLNTDSNLSNNNVHAILEDSLYRLWISTNKYLNCFDKVDSTIYVFTANEGITHEEFNKFSYFRDEVNNKFYFGGLDGYNCFNPNEIDLSKESSQTINIVEAQSIKRDGSDYTYSVVDISSKVLDIPQNDIVINLTLTSSNIFNSDERKFYYRIIELNNEWIPIDGNVLSLTKLPAGKYSLELIADLNNPVTQSAIKALKLNFKQPLYKSIYFIIPFVIFLLLLCYLWFKNKNERMKKKNRLLEKLVSERTQELNIANETKNKIIAILSHDLRSPMGGLRDYYEKLDFLIKKDRVDEIQEISKISRSRIQVLENTLDNLLIWALAESKTLTTQKELLSLHHEVNIAIKLSDHIIDRKQLEVINRLDVMDQIDTDKNILQTILRNMMHNAMKFSFEGGKVIIEKKSEDEDQMIISIRDFGLGMVRASENQKLIQLHNENQGLGFGLSTSRDLAEIENIEIDIHSEGMQGTEVLITIPKRPIGTTLE